MARDHPVSHPGACVSRFRSRLGRTEYAQIEIAWLNAAIYSKLRTITRIPMLATRRYSARLWSAQSPTIKEIIRGYRRSITAKRTLLPLAATGNSPARRLLIRTFACDIDGVAGGSLRLRAWKIDDVRRRIGEDLAQRGREDRIWQLV